jgi:glycosyltransferase involved in cell wall biosynthesis
VDFTLACDIMMDLEGSVRPAMYLADALAAIGHRVAIMSPVMSSDVEHHLSLHEIRPINLRAKLLAKNSGLSMLWFETWGREAFLRLNSRHVNRDSCATINFSHTLAVPSAFWYLQGPTSAALRDMEDELSTTYKSAYRILKPMLEYADGKLARDMRDESRLIIANSKFCASLYRDWGIEVCDVIYPPIDCKVFQPQTANPPGDYVLTYFGKETKFSVVKAIADLGVKVKAFGSKAPFIPRGLITHPNIDFMGKIPISQLVSAYSDALFTLFPFSHEPFGYIPVESMSCGTPTLTYNAQGPSESVVHGRTGWLVKSDDEMVGKAVDLWKEGYSQNMRVNCLREASKFDKGVYVKRWLDVLHKTQADGSSSLGEFGLSNSSSALSKSVVG